MADDRNDSEKEGRKKEPQGSFTFVGPNSRSVRDPVPPKKDELPKLVVRRVQDGEAGARTKNEGPVGPRMYSVGEIVGQAARLLDEHFANVWVEGEIEGFKRHQVSGNCYLALKDGTARIEAMLRRQVAAQLSVPLRDGLKVQVRGRLTLYKEQGRFQLYIEEVRLFGEGELLQKFEELKAKLAKEGLFDAARKRPLPKFPRVLGVVTSQSGAALQDILKVATRRGRVSVLVAHCAVQGPQAPSQIVDAMVRLAPHADVLIVGRGGGSVADLWCFNDERVARAMFACPVPVVSAVGHEVDFTIADFVADVRAATPSAAAELCVPEFARLGKDLSTLSSRLFVAGRRMLSGERQNLDGLFLRGQVALERQVAQKRRGLSELGDRLTAQHPRTQLLRNRNTLSLLEKQLDQGMERGLVARKTALQQAVGVGGERLLRAMSLALGGKRQALQGMAGKLDVLSPLSVLSRGYAVAKDERGRVLRDVKDVTVGASLSVQLARGKLGCVVSSMCGNGMSEEEGISKGEGTPKNEDASKN